MLEERLAFNEKLRAERACLEGERACPPEDVGAAPGYLEFCDALKDLDHEEHESYIEWSESINWELMKYLRWSQDRHQTWRCVV